MGNEGNALRLLGVRYAPPRRLLRFAPPAPSALPTRHPPGLAALALRAHPLQPP